jgi:hypothetical protein
MSIRSSSKANDYDTTGKLKYKDRNAERFVMVGFNTQDNVPVPVSPPSDGPEGGVRIATLGFNTLGIPSNVDSGGATFAQAVAMISAAKSAGYLSLKLNGLTAGGKGWIGEPDESGGTGVTFSTANSPSTVVIDGGNRVLGGSLQNYPFITVGSGVTLTLRNITLRVGGSYPVVRVDSGGTLILEEGAVIREHTNTVSNGGGVSDGGAVLVSGTLTMKGGEISYNNTNLHGGGVYVASGGTFTMQGGALKNNTAGNGGAVYVADGGTFFMQGGTVSGNAANTGSGGGVYVATGGRFVKSNGAIYANTAAGSSGSAVYVQGGRYRNDTVMDSLDSGKSINAGGWDYPVIPHTYYKTVVTDGSLAAGQVDWYVFTAPGGGAPGAVVSGPVKASAYRAYGAPISLTAATPAFAAGETVYVKVEGNAPGVTGNYSIRQGSLLLISNSDEVNKKANAGTITAAGQVDWYFFTAETAGTYSVMWEDASEQLPSSSRYDGDVEVWAYRYDATPIPELMKKDDGYNGGAGVSIDLDAGETIYVKAVGKSTGIGTYGIRYYAP